MNRYSHLQFGLQILFDRVRYRTIYTVAFSSALLVVRVRPHRHYGSYIITSQDLIYSLAALVHHGIVGYASLVRWKT